MISSFFSFLYRPSEDEISNHDNDSILKQFNNSHTVSLPNTNPEINSLHKPIHKSNHQTPSHTVTHVTKKISHETIINDQVQDGTNYTSKIVSNQRLQNFSSNTLNDKKSASFQDIDNETKFNGSDFSIINVENDDNQFPKSNKIGISSLYSNSTSNSNNSILPIHKNFKSNSQSKRRNDISISDKEKEKENKISYKKTNIENQIILHNQEYLNEIKETKNHKKLDIYYNEPIQPSSSVQALKSQKQIKESDKKSNIKISEDDETSRYFLTNVSETDLEIQINEVKLTTNRPHNPLSQFDQSSNLQNDTSTEKIENSSLSTSNSVQSNEKIETFKSIVSDIYKNDELKPGTIIKNKYRVTNNGVIGSGSFGVIYEVEHMESNIKYALKIIPSKYKQQSKNEQKFLSMLTNYEKNHVIRFLESLVWRGKVCLIFELLSRSLYDVLQLTHFKGIKLKTVQIIGRQVVSSLQYLAQLGIIHCDLKPENILLCPIKEKHFKEEHLRVKIIDFGSACNIHKGPFIKYIQSRFYRAPEVIFEQKYSFEIDIWSLGCLLFELHTGYPLFDGETETEMISKFVATIGLPPQNMIQNLIQNSSKALKWFKFNNDTKNYELLESLMLPSQPLSKRLRLDDSGKYMNTQSNEQDTNSNITDMEVKKKYTEAFHDILSQILTWNPRMRLNWDQLLKHPFFTLKFKDN